MDKAIDLVVAENYTKFKQMSLGFKSRCVFTPGDESKSREDDVNRIASTVLAIGQSEAEENGIITVTKPKSRTGDVERMSFVFDWPSTL